jgi:hypothetical protein
MPGVPRLLLLFHDPYHLEEGDARAWLRREVEAALRRDQLETARLTRLGSATSQPRGGFDWLLEFSVDRAATNPRAAIGELVADLRLLGMAPTVAVADDRNAVDLKPG